MLETKFVKFLQSRPYHIRALMFAIIMLTATIVSLSFSFGMVKQEFAAATNQNKMVEQKTTNFPEAKKAPSLLRNLKASIGDVGDVFSGLYSSLAKSVDNDDEIIKIRNIEPIKLPTEKQ